MKHYPVHQEIMYSEDLLLFTIYNVWWLKPWAYDRILVRKLT